VTLFGFIFNAFARLGTEAKVSNKKTDIERSSALVLPGVGAFECIKRIRPIEKVIINEIKEGKPLPGLCLGLLNPISLANLNTSVFL